MSFLLDQASVTLWDEDFPGGQAYTRSMLRQDCAERAQAFSHVATIAQDSCFLMLGSECWASAQVCGRSASERRGTVEFRSSWDSDDRIG